MHSSEPSPARAGAALAWLSRGALLVLGLGGCGGGAGDGRPRNAILISIDTLRPDHLSCYGHEQPTSPTLDELAANGVRFTDVTSAAPWTLPAHATMLTGLYPSHHGVKNHETRLALDQVTLAEEFGAHGFQTLAVVNTHNVGAPQFQLGQGFDQFRYIVETEEDPRTMKLRTYNSGEVVVSTAKELLRDRDEDRPFFLFLHFYDVHTDFTPKAEYKDMFVAPYSGRLTGLSTQLGGIRVRKEQLDAADLRWLREMYDAEIRQLDDLLGRFFVWLGEQGLSDDTVFLVTSDHGEEFQEHGSVLHGTTQYQELLRIPWLMRGPGIPHGQVIDQAVHGIDITPTLLSVMGIPSSVPRDGIDVSVAWKGGALPERVFFGEADHNNRIDGQNRDDIKRMVRRGTEKLHWDRYSGEFELYDIASDPGEQHDLWPGDAKEVKGLQRELERFLTSEIAPEKVAAPEGEERERLKALGYIGEDEPEPEKPAAPAAERE